MIGLTGSHRTGKTTLAKAWSERSGIEFVTISAGQVITDTLGKDCHEIVTLDDRLKVQRRLVEICDDTFLKRKAAFVSDRTPLDVAAYTLAAADQNMTPAQSEEMLDIVTDCIDLSKSCFHSMVLIPPALPYVVEPGKPPLNLAYQYHIHSLILSMLFDVRDGSDGFNWWEMNRQNVDINERLAIMDKIYQATFAEDKRKPVMLVS